MQVTVHRSSRDNSRQLKGTKPNKISAFLSQGGTVIWHLQTWAGDCPKVISSLLLVTHKYPRMLSTHKECWKRSELTGHTTSPFLFSSSLPLLTWQPKLANILLPVYSLPSENWNENSKWSRTVFKCPCSFSFRCASWSNARKGHVGLCIQICPPACLTFKNSNGF